MKIIVIGAGKIGRAIVKSACQEGHDIVVIDTKASIIDELVNKYDVLGIVGNGATLDIQKEADVKNSDLVIACTPDDATNILACLTAKKAGTKSTILRVRTPEYIDQMRLMKEELGLSMIVNPEYDTAMEIFNIITIPSVERLERFAKGQVNLFELVVDESSNLANKTLSEIGKIFKTKVLICVVVRDKQVIIPSGDFKIKENDHLYICIDAKLLASFLGESQLFKRPIKNLMIVGGGKLGFYLARELEKTRIHTTIIESDRDVAEQLSDTFNRINVICADGSDQDILLEEGIEDMDALCSLTNIDEQNIVISMFAKKIGVEKVITKIKRDTYSQILDNINLSTIISPKDVVCDRVIGYIRALDNKKGSNIVTIYKLLNGEIEAIEFVAKKKERFYNKPLSDLNLKKGILVAAIFRNGETIIPSGSSTIEQGDNVIIISKNHQLDDLGDIIA